MGTPGVKHILKIDMTTKINAPIQRDERDELELLRALAVAVAAHPALHVGDGYCGGGLCPTVVSDDPCNCGAGEVDRLVAEWVRRRG